jgi:GNAT superfamily N-acetyltransferase
VTAIVIEPLSAAYLERACALVDACFPHEPVHPDLTLRESLDKTWHMRQSILKEYGEAIDRIDFWIAIDRDSERVVGTSGLYMDMHDEREAAWMEWFCVDPAYRGQGIGALLLDKAIAEATARGKTFLRLYTSDEGGPTLAQGMYLERGFVLTQEKWDPVRQCTVYYMEKRL